MTVHPAPSRAPATSAGALLLALVAPLVLAVLAAPAALAHGIGDGLRYRIVSVDPPVDGLTVQVVRGLAPQLVLANDTGRIVSVLDDQDRPFLRIGPDGVTGDTASPTWRASDRPFGLGGGDPTDVGTAPPRWTPLSSDASWGWYDHRLHRQALTAPSDLTEPTVLATWDVPLTVGDRAVTVHGEIIGGPVTGVAAARLTTAAEVAPEVTASLLPGTLPGLLLEVGGDGPVVVRGETGEPFLRFADGQVAANLRSPTWYRVSGRDPGAADPGELDAGAPPDWQVVADGMRYGWVEPRATAPEVTDPPDTETVLATWSVPIEVGGRVLPVAGETRWVPLAAPSGAGGRIVDVAMALAGVGAVAALVWARRRQGRARAERARARDVEVPADPDA